MTDRQPIRRGDRVLVWATVNSPTNERTPSGLWWVNVDGNGGCVAVQEYDMVVPPGESVAKEGKNE